MKLTKRLSKLILLVILVQTLFFPLFSSASTKEDFDSLNCQQIFMVVRTIYGNIKTIVGSIYIFPSIDENKIRVHVQLKDDCFESKKEMIDAIDKIVDSIEPTEDDLIIEIGPGSGALTKKLKKYDATLIAFEIDLQTKQYLDKLEDEKTQIIYQDFLTADILKILDKYNFTNLYIIGNLPYYITTPIIEHIIKLNLNVSSMVFMVQKEIADRFLSKPKSKNYGYMTVILNYWFNIEKIIDVDKKNFVPMPKVDSTVLRLSRKETLCVDYDKFDALVKDSFKFKRKTLNNNLKSYNRRELEIILNKHGYTLENRAEEIDLETFIDLTNNI